MPILNFAQAIVRRHASAASLFILLGLSGCAALNDRSINFTAEEREQFTEAPRLLKSWTVGNFWSGDFAWLDDTRVVITFSPGGGVYARVGILDVYTGKLELTPHEGMLICYADGNVVVAGRNRSVLYGRLGGELENRPGTMPELVPASCLEPWYTDKYGKRVAHRRDPQAFYRISPLRQGDGVLRQRLTEWEGGKSFGVVADQWQRDNPGKPLPGFEAELVSEKGEVKKVLRTSPVITFIGYDTYLGKYFTQGFYFTPEGEMTEPATMPEFLSKLRRGGGSAQARIGKFYPNRSEPSFWRKQGLYYVRDSKIYRLDKAWPYYPAGISPNGCLFAYKRSEGNPWINGRSNPRSNPKIIELKIIDVCNAA